VELKPDGDRQIFLSGPLLLKAGVTLEIDADAALFASRGPRDYDLAPGSCGVVNQRGRGCKPFLAAIRQCGIFTHRNGRAHRGGRGTPCFGTGIGVKCYNFADDSALH
jgi:polygalacturonase